MLRRHGRAKLSVMDVARAAGMSHANVYKHFSSKAALRDAAAERWLQAIARPLTAIAGGPAPPSERLRAWFHALHEAKLRRVLQDPELFATCHAIAEDAPEVAARHASDLRSMLARILADGVAQGTWRVADPAAMAESMLAATLAFHHPEPVRATAGVDRSAALDQLLALLEARLHADAG